MIRSTSCQEWIGCKPTRACRASRTRCSRSQPRGNGRNEGSGGLIRRAQNDFANRIRHAPSAISKHSVFHEDTQSRASLHSDSFIDGSGAGISQKRTQTSQKLASTMPIHWLPSLIGERAATVLTSLVSLLAIRSIFKLVERAQSRFNSPAACVHPI